MSDISKSVLFIALLLFELFTFYLHASFEAKKFNCERFERDFATCEMQ